MRTGFRLRYLRNDADLLKLEAFASNGRFSAFARAYAGVNSLAEAAEALEGFPRDSADVRELQFGTFGNGAEGGSETEGGAVHMRFFSTGAFGHTVLEIRFEDECERNSGSRWKRPDQTAHFFGWTEPFAVAEFVAEIRQMDESKSGEACLRFHERGL
jgi:hypothetical protein